MHFRTACRCSPFSYRRPTAESAVRSSSAAALRARVRLVTLPAKEAKLLVTVAVSLITALASQQRVARASSDRSKAVGSR